jgi:ABC-type bacteriocin/lantibiotic exporter with double-glycine peptidase domain
MSSINNNPSNNREQLSEEQLLSYLTKGLTGIEAHNIEKQSLQDPFVADALEGLGQIKDKQQINRSIAELNKKLAKSINKREQKKRKRKLPSNQYTLIAILVILILMVLAYFVLHLKGIN